MSISTELLQRAQVTANVDVRFAETDAMGVVHHAAYVVWLEMGRIAWLDAVDVPYVEVAASGHHFAVTGVQIQYRTSCAFGDKVEIVTYVSSLRSRQIEFAYSLSHATNGTLIATAASEHICVNRTGKMSRLPVRFWERLQIGIRQLAANKDG